MNTKLTLTMEQKIIEKAKKYASQHGRSLSDIIENYLMVLTKDNPHKKDHEIAPLTKSLKGTFKAPKDFDYKKELRKGLAKKYLDHG